MLPVFLTPKSKERNAGNSQEIRFLDRFSRSFRWRTPFLSRKHPRRENSFLPKNAPKKEVTKKVLLNLKTPQLKVEK
jgi:hypothetical protein